MVSSYPKTVLNAVIILSLIILYNFTHKRPNNDCSPVEGTVDDIIWRYHTEGECRRKTQVETMSEAMLMKLRRSDPVCSTLCMKQAHLGNWHGFLVMADDPSEKGLRICGEHRTQTCSSGRIDDLKSRRHHNT